MDGWIGCLMLQYCAGSLVREINAAVIVPQLEMICTYFKK